MALLYCNSKNEICQVGKKFPLTNQKWMDKIERSSGESVNPDIGFALFLFIRIWLWQLSIKVSLVLQSSRKVW